MFDFFKKPQPSVENQQQQQQQQQQQTEEPKNPLDAYDEIFKKASEASNEDEIPNFALDESVVDEVAGKLNFLDPELLARAKEGDAEAMIALIQKSSQKAYRAGLQHSVALTNTHLKSRDAVYSKTLGKGVKQTLVSQAIADIPNANHPVIQRELSRIAADIAKENPDATPQQIAKEAKRYFAEIHSVMTEKPAQQKTTKPLDLKEFLDM